MIVPDEALQIGDTEIEMKAYSYTERVEKQDEICLLVKQYVEKHVQK